MQIGTGRKKGFVEMITSPQDRTAKIFPLRETVQRTDGFSNHCWKTNGLVIITHLLRFVKRFLTEYSLLPLRIMNKQIFGIINDQAADYPFLLHNGYLGTNQQTRLSRLYKCLPSVFQQRYSLLSNEKWLLKPDDIFMIIWNFYLLIVVIVNVCYVSLRLAFPEISESSLTVHILVLEYLPSYSYLFEIILKFNTCPYKQGILIQNRKRIILEYLTHEFFADCAIIIPFFIAQKFSFRLLDFIIIFKVFQIRTLTQSLFNKLELTSRQAAIFDISRFIFFMILVAHFCACLWHAIGQWGEWGDQSANSWLKQAEIQDSQWYDRYIFSFYWSIVTMTTIGYGEITPVNSTERTFVIFIAIFATAVFAYSVNNMGQIFQDLQHQQWQFKNNMNNLNRYLRSQKISKDIQDKFRRYFEYLWNQTENNSEIQFKSLIPEHLKQAMIADINYQILMKIPFFQQFSKQFLQKVSPQFTDFSIHREDILFKRQAQHTQLIVMTAGEIQLEVTVGGKSKKLHQYNQPSALGLMELLLNKPFSYDAKAIRNSNLIQISREEFEKTLKLFRSDYEIYRLIVDQVTFQQRLDLTNSGCRLCKSDKHFITECNLVSFKMNKNKAIKISRRRTQNDRQPFKRQNDTRKVSALKHKFLIMESLIQYLVKSEDHSQLEVIQSQLLQTVNQQEVQPMFRSQKEKPTNVQKVSFAMKSSTSMLNNSILKHSASFRNLQDDVEDAEQPNENQTSSGRAGKQVSMAVQLKNDEMDSLKCDDDTDCEIKLRNQNQEKWNQLMLDKVQQFEIYKPNENCDEVLKSLPLRIIESEQHQRKTKKHITILSLLRQTQMLRQTQKLPSCRF